MLLWLTHFVFWYIIYMIVYYKCSPRHIDPSSAAQRKGVTELPKCMCQIVHAIYTCVYGYGYLFDWFSIETLYLARAGSTGFLCFDFIYTWRNYDRFKAISEFTEQYHARPSKHTSAFLNTHHPGGVAFHHIVTLLLMYGFRFGGSATIGGSVLFFRGELPVFFIQVFWLYCYYGLQDTTRAASLVSNLAVFSYFVCRILMFLGYFLFYIFFPYMDWSSVISWIFTALLTLIFWFNCMWFAGLVRQNKEYFPGGYCAEDQIV